MKKHKIILISISVLFISLISYLTIDLVNYKYFNDNEVITPSNKIKTNNNLAIMVETDGDTDTYEKYTGSGWPTDGYEFNTELSRCENGSTLSWDSTNKQVIMTGDTIDKCYIYFDVEQQSLVDYIISLYTGVQGGNSLYYHDDDLDNGAGDNSYRYAGANPNNYVCFGSDASPCPNDNLYRIIGVIDNKIKLIKYDYANSNLLGSDGDYGTTSTPDATYYKGSLSSVNTYYWNYKATGSATNTWSTSLLNKTNLNTNFLNNIGYDWANKIIVTTWKVGGSGEGNIRSVIPSSAYKYEVGISSSTTTYGAKIGLVYVSDYGFAASSSSWSTVLSSYSQVKGTNWMYMGLNEWTITPNTDMAVATLGIYSFGYVSGFTVSGALGIRPVFSLYKPTIYAGGTGTKENPYRIKTGDTFEFTVNNVSYTAKNGMTWNDYINSDYNYYFKCVSTLVENLGNYGITKDSILTKCEDSIEKDGIYKRGRQIG